MGRWGQGNSTHNTQQNRQKIEAKKYGTLHFNPIPGQTGQILPRAPRTTLPF